MLQTFMHPGYNDRFCAVADLVKRKFSQPLRPDVLHRTISYDIYGNCSTHNMLKIEEKLDFFNIVSHVRDKFRYLLPKNGFLIIRNQLKRLRKATNCYDWPGNPRTNCSTMF
jgi:hypothetical protein